MFDNFLIRKDSLENEVDENGNVIGFKFAARNATTGVSICHSIMDTISKLTGYSIKERYRLLKSMDSRPEHLRN